MSVKTNNNSKTHLNVFHLPRCHTRRNPPQSMIRRWKEAKLLCLLITKSRFWTIASYSSLKIIPGGQAPDRIGPDEYRIPPRGGITLQAAALRVNSGGQVPGRLGLDDCRIPPRGGITLQATALRVTLVQTIAEFPRAVVLLFKLPLYESLMEVKWAIALAQATP